MHVLYAMRFVMCEIKKAYVICEAKKAIRCYKYI